MERRAAGDGRDQGRPGARRAQRDGGADHLPAPVPALPAAGRHERHAARVAPRAARACTAAAPTACRCASRRAGSGWAGAWSSTRPPSGRPCSPSVRPRWRPAGRCWWAPTASPRRQRLSAQLAGAGIEHQVLNALQDADEAAQVARAGQAGTRHRDDQHGRPRHRHPARRRGPRRRRPARDRRAGQPRAAHRPPAHRPQRPPWRPRLGRGRGRAGRRAAARAAGRARCGALPPRWLGGDALPRGWPRLLVAVAQRGAECERRAACAATCASRPSAPKNRLPLQDTENERSEHVSVAAHRRRRQWRCIVVPPRRVAGRRCAGRPAAPRANRGGRPATRCRGWTA